MNTYKRHRFPPHIISYAFWLYYRFNPVHRDIEDSPAERGVTVSREAVRLWCIKFGSIYARRLRRRHLGYGDTFFIDEVFVKIKGKQHYLWRAVDWYANNRAEQSLQATRVRQRGMRKFKSTRQAQRFVTVHAAVSNLFNLGRQLLRPEHYRNLMISAFADWSRAVA